MTTKNRNLAKGMLPAFLLSAALSVPATALAAPAAHGKAHAADKAKNHQEKAQQHAQQARQHAQQAERQARKAEQQARKAQQAQRGRNQKQAVVVVAPQRRVAVAPQRVVVVPARPVVVAQQRNRNRAQWDGWNRGYNRYSTGIFELDAVSVGRESGCALVRDHQGQVIPLVGIDPFALRNGDHLLFSGRIQNNTACGTAFRVNRVEKAWADANHRRLVFDSRRDGDYLDYHSRERYADRDRYDDRYARDRDRYDDRYDRNDDRYDDRSDNRVLSIDGRIDDRGRCTAIRGDHGEYYDLLGDLRGLGDGDHVRVIGYPGVRSSCGGQAIEIQEIRRR